MHDPNDHPQTHDTLGRVFADPIPGGPVPGRLNIVVGAPKAGSDVLVSFQDDERSADVAVGAPDGPRVYTLEQILEVLQPLLAGAEPYAASLAYYLDYRAYVSDRPFHDAVDACCTLLDEHGVVYDDEG